MFNIFEQTVVFFGEPKLGLWRIQENGFIREYRKYAKNGLRETADPNDPNLPWSDFEVIKNNYEHGFPPSRLEAFYSNSRSCLTVKPPGLVAHIWTSFRKRSGYHPI